MSRRTSTRPSTTSWPTGSRASAEAGTSTIKVVEDLDRAFRGVARRQPVRLPPRFLRLDVLVLRDVAAHRLELAVGLRAREPADARLPEHLAHRRPDRPLPLGIRGGRAGLLDPCGPAVPRRVAVVGDE